jgi:hypothetical protein
MAPIPIAAAYKTMLINATIDETLVRMEEVYMVFEFLARIG